MLKIVRAGLLALLVLCIGVQVNDPDGPLWMLLYGMPACLLALALCRPAWLCSIPGRALWVGIVSVLLAAMVYHWPSDSGWWRRAIWWETEAAREGIGLMIACLFALCSFVRRPCATGQADPAADSTVGRGG